MICPQCQSTCLKVIDSRDVENEPAIRRRRECEDCGHRFTTYERVEAAALRVMKKDGRREAFQRDKLARGIWKACEKRPVSDQDIETLIDTIEADLRSRGESEVHADSVGEAVMDHLKTFDQIAYIRFASVYREFADLGELQREVARTLRSSKQTTHNQKEAHA